MKVFVVNILKMKAKVDELTADLSSEEVLFAERLKNSNAKDRFIISKAMVRKILADTKPLKGTAPASIEIKLESNGKPYVAGNPIYYNVSHSKDLLVVAVDNADVGVDIEHMKERDFRALTRYYFDGREGIIECISQSSDVKTEFYKQWTLAEAEAKLAGVGVFGWKQQKGQSGAKFHYSRTIGDDYMLTVASNVVAGSGIDIGMII